MTYAKNLPANLGNTDILRAIYDKIGEIAPSEDKIDGKLDDIIERIDEVKYSINKDNESISGAIVENTQAIKDVANNVKGISDVNVKGFESITNALKNEESEDTKPHPKPFPPYPRHCHHYKPCPPVPPPPFYNCAYSADYYLPNAKDMHNKSIESNPNLTRQQKNYLNDVYNGNRKFNPKEYHSLPQFVPPMYIPMIKDLYYQMIYSH